MFLLCISNAAMNKYVCVVLFEVYLSRGSNSSWKKNQTSQ